VKLLKRNISNWSDEDLILRYSSKQDNRCIEELHNRYSRQIVGFFYKMLHHDEALAKDFTQDVFIKVMERSHQFNAQYKFYTWLFTIASNHCKTHFSSWKERQFTALSNEFDIQEAGNDIEKELDKPQLKKAIRNAYLELSFEHRSAFILRYNHQMTVKEIAEITQTKEGTIKSRIYHATKLVSEKVNPRIIQSKQSAT